MKELYISPEAKLTCFAAVESLASEIDKDTVDMDGLAGKAGLDTGVESVVTPMPGFDLEFDA